MSCHARFQLLDGRLFRFDTKIYLGESQSPCGPGVCVGAFVGKNPGSASLAAGDRQGVGRVIQDHTLRMIRYRFTAAYSLARIPIPKNAFVRVWNLFYLCEPDYAEARRVLGKMGSNGLECETEKVDHPEIVWFGWGGADKKTVPCKARFQKKEPAHPFYFDRAAGKICRRVPSEFDAAAHPQGLPLEPIVACLAAMLRNLAN